MVSRVSGLPLHRLGEDRHRFEHPVRGMSKLRGARDNQAGETSPIPLLWWFVTHFTSADSRLDGPRLSWDGRSMADIARLSCAAGRPCLPPG